MTGDLRVYRIARTIADRYRPELRKLTMRMMRDAYRTTQQARIPTYRRSGKGCTDTEAWVTLMIVLDELSGWRFELLSASNLALNRSREFKRVARK